MTPLAHLFLQNLSQRDTLLQRITMFDSTFVDRRLHPDMGPLLQQARTAIVTILRICLILLMVFAAPIARADLPDYVLPGTPEAAARAALPLIDCQPWPADARNVDCKTGPVRLDGMPGTYKVTFTGGIVVFGWFFTERKNYDGAVRTVATLMGAPNRDERFDVPAGVNGANVTQQVKTWANRRLLASVMLYTPGVDGVASIFLLHTAAVPEEVRATYQPPR